jgi:hypothetical protein
MATATTYPVTFDVEYPERLSRWKVVFKPWLLGLPAYFMLYLVEQGIGYIIPFAFFSILFRRKYPRWSFDFLLGFYRYQYRVAAYGLNLWRDEYPALEDSQAVKLDIEYPEADTLNRWLPIVKWLLAIPHLIILVFLFIAVFVVLIIAWFAILFTARYPKGLFDFTVGANRWGVRVAAYAFLLMRDEYPPFSLAP